MPYAPFQLATKGELPTQPQCNGSLQSLDWTGLVYWHFFTLKNPFFLLSKQTHLPA